MISKYHIDNVGVKELVMDSKTKLKRALVVTGAAAGTAFLVMRHIAKKQYPHSVYDDQPDEKNVMEGKKVIFVEDVNDPVNADGMQGHLEAVGVTGHTPTFYEKYVKRGMDIAISFSGLLLLSPVYAATAMAIKSDDPGPVIFRQKRVAQDKGYFQLMKFRSMSVNTPKDVPTHMLKNGGITKVGAFIRKTSIDELPQLWNIFLGNMSVIGPRPALWNQDFLTAERDKYGANDIKPGLTGLAQINGRDELEIPEKAKLDGVYADELRKGSLNGFIMDAKMFLGSISSVLRRKGIVEGGTGAIAREFSKAEGLGEEESAGEVPAEADAVAKDTVSVNRTHTYSVLMSVYKNDDPEFLDIALKSIYEHQTVKPDEIVVVFDGPLTEELYDVLDRFREGKESVVRYYPQEENHGLGEALRIGSEKCTCDYIFRMDSDDISDPRRFEKQISYVEAHPDIDVLGTDIAEFNNSTDEDMRVRSCPENHEDIVKMGRKRNPMNHVSVCMKRSALERCGGYKTLLLLEDYYLWLNMIAAKCRLANIHESLVYVRVGNGFDSKRGSKERITGWKTLQDFMLEHEMIAKKEAVMNMIYIHGFVRTPAWSKKLLYKAILRK